jgi:hypothetical protein
VPSNVLPEGSTGTRPVQPTAAPAPVAAPAPAAEPATPPHQQILAALTPIRGGRSGEHQLIVQLHPADLGPVSIVARFEQGTLSVVLASTSDAARDALHSSLPQLRNDLQQAGFSGVAVALDGGSGDPGRAGREPAANPLDLPNPQPDAPGTGPRQQTAAVGAPTMRMSALDRLL